MKAIADVRSQGEKEKNSRMKIPSERGNHRDIRQQPADEKHLNTKLSDREASNQRFNTDLQLAEENIEDRDQVIISLQHQLSAVKHKYAETCKELQEGREKSKIEVKKRDQQITTFQQSLQDQTEKYQRYCEEFSLFKEELEKEIIEMKKLLIDKDKEVSKARKRARAHRATLYQLEEAQKALEEDRGCIALKDEVKQQLAEREELHLSEYPQREESFRKVLSEQLEMLKKKLGDTESDLKQQLSEMEERLQKELSDRKEMAKQCTILEKKTEQLEEDKSNLKDVLSQTENIFNSEVGRWREGVQPLMQENTRLQELLMWEEDEDGETESDL